MDPRLVPLLTDQSGVVSRRQAHEAGLAAHDLARLLRRRDLTRLHPGVYVDHTGEPTFVQRAWGAVQLYWPAALSGDSALRAAEGPGSRRDSRVVELVVDRHRHVSPPPSIRVTRSERFSDRVLWNVGPPRLRYEEAALDVAALAATELEAVGELSRAVQTRRTTAERMLWALRDRTRVPRRSWLAAVLRDVAQGTCSVLEREYLHRVERPHGLDVGRRQVRDRLGAGSVYRDVLYGCGLVVELDGRLFHDTAAQRDRDFDRDLETAARGLSTVRLSYGQVLDRPCWTASRIAALMHRLGRPGGLRRCPGCALAA
jgi:hypothetical protein